MLKPLRLCSLCDGLGKHFYFLFNVRVAQILPKTLGEMLFGQNFKGILYLGFKNLMHFS
jgi:hypothetical protein